MKSSGQGTNGVAQPAKPNQLASISERKVKANRENAKKSTGPRTPRGKAFSRRNALKHGLFVRDIMSFVAQLEDPDEYEELLKGVRNQYQPVGVAEELEVERVALSWWRLKRAWRYENSVNRAALRDAGKRELAGQAEWCRERDKEEDAMILQLQGAMEEIKATGQIPEELKQEMFATMPGLERLWPSFETGGQELLKLPPISKIFREASAEERPSIVALSTAIAGVYFLKELRNLRQIAITEIAIGQHLVLDREALDRLLRYEAAIDRGLNRALDRLERLQRRRKGEPVPPRLNMRLTQ